MKKTLVSLLFAATASLNVTAADIDCGIVVGMPAGGLADIYARTLQKLNNNIGRVENKVATMQILAIDYMGYNPNFMLLASPTMYSTQNPNKVPKVELIEMFMGYDLVAVTTKDITFKRLMTEKINIGIPLLGSAQHIIALQLKDHNPLIEIIPTGGDAKALILLVNKQLDVYVSGKGNLSVWEEKYKLQTIIDIPAGKTIKKDNVTLRNFATVAMWSHVSATAEQKHKLATCLNETTSNPLWPDEARRMGGVPLSLTKEEGKKLLEDFIAALKKYDI